MLVRRLILLLCLGISALASAYTRANKVKELVLNNPTAAHFTTRDHKGLLDIVAGEAFRRAGLRLKLVKLPAERALINANDGTDDGDLSRIAGIEKVYPNLIRVPEMIFKMDFVAFTQHKLVKHASWRSLRPFSVGYITGWKIFDQNLLPGTEITTAEAPQQLMTMLKLGRIQFALYSRWMGLAILKHMHYKDIQVIEPPLAQRAMYIYLNKRYRHYIPALSKALKAIKREGIYSRVCKERFAAIATPTAQCDVH
ncbi:MAG: transporter substrate-binding domain-containing protein [Gammaproteobacteria bacterium]